MAESAYAVVSKTIGSNPVWVQVPLKPPHRSSPLSSPETSAKASHGDQSGPRLTLVKKVKIYTFSSTVSRVLVTSY
jgi:hypothetical protein